MSVEDRSINLFCDGLTGLLFFMLLNSVVTVLLDLWNKYKLSSTSATEKMRSRGVRKSACYTEITLVEYMSKKMHGEMNLLPLSTLPHFLLHFV